MKELLDNAFNGVNLIPTILFIVILFYWITVIIGIIDLDLFDIDADMDFDGGLGGEDEGIVQAILVFLNLKEIPIMIVISIFALIFWILAMLLYLTPIKSGGLINGLLLVPIFVVSVILAKFITNPLKGLFKNIYEDREEEADEVIGQIAKVLCDIKNNRLGQGEIERDGASILINIKAEFPEDIFIKDEEACVTKKDDEKNLYYIVKTYSKK